MDGGLGRKWSRWRGLGLRQTGVDGLVKWVCVNNGLLVADDGLR